MTHPRTGDAALLGAAFFYGTTFVIVKGALDDASPSAFLAARFGVAALVLAPLALSAARRRPTPGLGRAAVAAGGTMAAGYALQTVGLQYTTPSRSAFITYLLVVIVPVLASVTIRRVPHRRVVVAVGVASVGLFILTDLSTGGFGRGDVLTLGCALAFAANVVVIAAVIGRHDAVLLTFLQLVLMTVVFAIPGQLQGGYAFGTGVWAAIVFTGLFASAGAFFLQNWGQRTVGPSRAALLLVMEPVFAVALDFARGDRLGGTAFLGAGLIVIAVVISERRPPAERASRSS